MKRSLRYNSSLRGQQERPGIASMPTIISHGVAAIALGKCYPGDERPARFWVLAAVSAALPDADVIGFGLGIKYDDLLGHRGLTHSFFFALMIAFLVVLIFFKNIKPSSSRWWSLVACFFIVTASHGILDAMTNGGLGVAFFSPFSNSRYFFPWTPIEVSPLDHDGFFSPRGMSVIISEIIWVWIPSGLLILVAESCRRLFPARQR
jgi:inner membrane protein